MLSAYRVLPLLVAAVLTCSLCAVTPARADDDAALSDDDSNDDIDFGEISTDGDDFDIPSGRRRGGGGAAGRGTPRFTTGPSVRLSVAHRFAPDLSAELYGRSQIGAVTEPSWSSRSGLVAAGAVINKSFGAFVWSNSVETSQNYRDFYDGQTHTAWEVTSALGRVIKLGDSPLSITPRIGTGYLWASSIRLQRWKTELSVPLTYKVTKQFDLILTPKLEYETYDSRPDNRRDVTGYLGLGFKYEVVKGMTLSAAIGYESRESSVPRSSMTRWKLSPQISLRKEL